MVSSLPNPAASWSNKFVCNSNSLHHLLKSKLGNESIFLPKLHQDLCVLAPPATAISGQDKLQPRCTEYISHISKDAGLHSGKNFKWKGFISKLCKGEGIVQLAMTPSTQGCIHCLIHIHEHGHF